MSIIHDDFLLDSAQAKRLYHEYAASAPIIDYHCHLPPDQIAANYRYRNMTDVWLSGDHYKWRAMRANGVDEQYVTGHASDKDKFRKWAETVPYLLRNPLYHWTHLELARYFDIDDLLGPATADQIWDACNEMLTRPEFRCRQLMERSRVVLTCTTDDPTDSLEHHRAIAADADFKVQVLPTWRPDKALAVDNPGMFNAWVARLEESADVDIVGYDGFMGAIEKRHAFFHAQGCCLSDHGTETLYSTDYDLADIKAIFEQVRAGKRPSAASILKWRSALLHEFAIMDHSRGWTQQYHFGALRNNNTRKFRQIGPDAGFDSIGDWPVAQEMSRFFDKLDEEDRLARTIIYNLNPRDNFVVATMIGNFQDGRTPGKMQFGSGWWHLDQLQGMEQQINDLSVCGLLSRFVGMLTDSRSFLSYPRHEYFRRLLCRILGDDMARGLIPDDIGLVGGMVRDISYRNAARYFGFDVDPDA